SGSASSRVPTDLIAPDRASEAAWSALMVLPIRTSDIRAYVITYSDPAALASAHALATRCARARRRRSPRPGMADGRPRWNRGRQFLRLPGLRALRRYLRRIDRRRKTRLRPAGAPARRAVRPCRADGRRHGRRGAPNWDRRTGRAARRALYARGVGAARPSGPGGHGPGRRVRPCRRPNAASSAQADARPPPRGG